MRARPPHLSRRIAAALLSSVATLYSGAAPGQEVALSPAALRSAAVMQLDRGRPDTAMLYAEGLVLRDPDDLAAHLIRARAARDLGRFDTARASARVAWRLAETPADRYAEAMTRARVLSSAGARTRAEFWLRRAADIAPSGADRARAVRDFRYVSARNPWSTRLNLSVAPSSNVNGGSSSDTADIGGFPFALQGTSQALSGVAWSAGLDTRYTLAAAVRTRTDLHLSAFHETYTLSERARDIAPEAEGADFARSALSFGITQDWSAGGGRLGGSLGAAVSQGWYGGEPLTRTRRLSGTLRYVLTPRGVGEASLSRDWQAGFGSRADAATWRAALGAVATIPGGHRLGAALSRLESRSDADFLDYDQTGLALTLALSRPLPILETAVSLGLSTTYRQHDATAFGPGARSERNYGASAEFTLGALERYGFAPTLTLRAERTEATLGLYDREEAGLELGIRSRF